MISLKREQSLNGSRTNEKHGKNAILIPNNVLSPLHALTPSTPILGQSAIYRQPGLLCTPQNFAQSLKFLGKKYFFAIKVISEAFLSISQNLKVTRLQGGTQKKR
jgi:hypothetical protein